jgi:hypothetical protein
LPGDVIKLPPYGRGTAVIGELALLTIWGGGCISFLLDYRWHTHPPQVAIFPAVISVMLLGTVLIGLLLLWSLFGFTVIRVDDVHLRREYRIGGLKIGSGAEFDMEHLKNLRLVSYTVRRRSGLVTRYAIDFDYLGRTIRLFHDPIPDRLTELLQGRLSATLHKARG